MGETREKSVMPLIAGILAIVSGGFKLLALFGMFVAVLVIPVSQGYGFFGNVSLLLSILTIPVAVLGILAIVGGIFAVQRKRFGWAITGSIAALIPFSSFGLASIILLLLSKDKYYQ